MLDPLAVATTDQLDIVSKVIGIAATVSGSVVALGVFVVRALVARDLKPMGDVLTTLVSEQQATRRELEQDRAVRREDRGELREWRGALDTRVRALETARGRLS